MAERYYKMTYIRWTVFLGLVIPFLTLSLVSIADQSSDMSDSIWANAVLAVLFVSLPVTATKIGQLYGELKLYLLGRYNGQDTISDE